MATAAIRDPPVLALLAALAVFIAGGGARCGEGSVTSPVILNEIHYHPPKDQDGKEEFIELHNRTGREADLQGWELKGGVRFRFDRSAGPSVIPPKGFLVVAKDPAWLSRTAGLPRAAVAGPFSGKLSNHGDRIVLCDLEGKVMDRVEYGDDGPWPARADGLGSSLQRISAEAPASLPENWTVSQGLRPEGKEIVLFENGARARWFECRAGRDPGFSVDVPWYYPEFDDVRNRFRDGRIAVGFDIMGRGRQGWINTDSTAAMGLHSILTRIPFEVPEKIPEGYLPHLFMDWDDGVIAWLNGVEVARMGMRLPPGVVPPFDGTYRADVISAGGDEEAESGYQLVWIGRREDLRPGKNLLALGNYNSGPRSTDLFATAKLVLAPGGGSSDFTPGRANSLVAPAAPPLVTLLDRAPREARSKDRVLVRAEVRGEGVSAVTLFYDAGDGEKAVSLEEEKGRPGAPARTAVYVGEIPPALDLTVVRFRVEARGAGGGTGRFPREGNPSRYAGYYVVDSPPQENEDLLVFHMLWRGDLKCTRGIWRKGSVFVHRGTAYLDVGFKYRGETSCGRPKSGMKVKFNLGDLFEGRRELNLLGLWEDRSLLREKLAWDLFRDIGHPHCRAEIAAVYETGNRFRGVYTALDEPGEGYLRRNGLDPGGALWKCRNSMSEDQSPGFGSNRLLTALDDRTDDEEAAEFARKLNALEGKALIDFILENIDVESLIEYQAVKCLISDEDGFKKNWMLYHGARKDPGGRVSHRWSAHPWDLDLSFGQINLSDEEVHTTKHPLMGTADHGRHGSDWNGLIEGVFGRRSGDFFLKALYGRIWGLLREKFNPRVLGAKVDRIDGNTSGVAWADLERWPRWGFEPANPEVHRKRLREYIEARTEFLLDFLTSENETTLKTERPAGTIVNPRSGISRRTALRGGALRTFRYTPAPVLKITEILCDPDHQPDLEFIEIRSLEGKAVDLSGWDIPALEYVFPEGSSIPAGAAIVVAKDPGKLIEAHGGMRGIDRARIFGPYKGSLDRKGADLRLRDNGLYNGKKYFPETIDAVKYRSSPPWPADSGGRGKSLELRDLSLDNDLPGSWRLSAEKGGTPGR